MSSMAEEFAIATYDSTFKKLTSDNLVRGSLISACLFGDHGHLPFNTNLLNGHLNPLRQHEGLREIVSRDNLKSLFEKIVESPDDTFLSISGNPFNPEDIIELANHWNEMRDCFPSIKLFHGIMDLCSFAGDEYFIVEMQQINGPGLFERMWSYCAYVYARTREPGKKWRQVAPRKVTALVFVGTGKASAHAVNSRYKVRHRIYREADDESGPHLVPENMMEVIFVYINSDNLQGASDVEKQWLYLLRYSRLIQSAPGVARALELLNVARWSDHEIEAYRSEVSMIFELEETVGVLTSQLEDKRAQLEDTQTQLEDTQTQLHDMQTQLEDTQAQMQVQLQVQAQMQARILELEAKLGENHDDSPERSRSSSSSEKRKDMDTLSQVSQQHRKKK